MSRLPVVIAAYNEEKYIDRALSPLDQEVFEPIVAANGCEDSTVIRAKEHGVEVLDIPVRGKLPAMQEAVRSLGDRALEPILFLDADSRPAFPKVWAKVMVSALAADRPSAATGTLAFVDGGRVADTVRTTRFYNMKRGERRSAGTNLSGPNMAVRLHNEETLEHFLSMPHIWPGEDHAIGRMLSLRDGRIHHVLDPRAIVLTSARYIIPLSERLRIGRDAAGEQRRQDYLTRAPHGSRPFRPTSKLGY